MHVSTRISLFIPKSKSFYMLDFGCFICYTLYQMFRLSNHDFRRVEKQELFSEGFKSALSKSRNILLYSENLIALKAIRKNFKDTVKCVYLDPPYNSGLTFDYGKDSKTSREWLNFMRKRLKIIHDLIAPDGFLFLQISSGELHYVKVLLDKIFGRQNYRNSIIIKKDRHTHNTGQTIRQLDVAYHTILVYSKKPETLMPNMQYDENWLDLYANGHLTDFVHELNEDVVKRVLNWVTDLDDIVLDAFCGSGTTCAVAQKLGRRWIGIEQGMHCSSVCWPRIQAIAKEQGAENSIVFFECVTKKG